MADNTNPQTQQSAGQSNAGAAQDQSLFSRFDIPEAVQQQYPDLVPLILKTESMNDDERQYWFSILPIMSEEQVAKLREILANEKQQLAQIDKEYEKEVKRISDKNVIEWKEHELKQKREKRQASEQSSEKSEKETEEELLKKLQEL